MNEKTSCCGIQLRCTDISSTFHGDRDNSSCREYYTHTIVFFVHLFRFENVDSRFWSLRKKKWRALTDPRTHYHFMHQICSKHRDEGTNINAIFFFFFLLRPFKSCLEKWWQQLFDIKYSNMRYKKHIVEYSALLRCTKLTAPQMSSTITTQYQRWIALNLSK